MTTFFPRGGRSSSAAASAAAAVGTSKREAGEVVLKEGRCSSGRGRAEMSMLSLSVVSCRLIDLAGGPEKVTRSNREAKGAGVTRLDRVIRLNRENKLVHLLKRQWHEIRMWPESIVVGLNCISTAGKFICKNF